MSPIMVTPAILFIALLCAGIGTGGAYTTYFELDPRNVAPAFWVTQLQHAIKHIGVPLFVVQPLAALTTIASAVLALNDRPCLWFLVVAGAAMLVAALVTRFGNIPINHQLVTFRPDALPPEIASLQARWWTFHVARFVALVVGFSALVVGALMRRG
jgi:hypothetical protein